MIKSSNFTSASKMFEECEWDQCSSVGDGISNKIVDQVLYKGSGKPKGKVRKVKSKLAQDKHTQSDSVLAPESLATPTQLKTNDTSVKPTKVSRLRCKMSKRLSGARFRWINEQLYTSTGSEALQLFTDNPDLFTVYHQGFNEQVSKWPRNPLDYVIEYIKAVPESFIIADFGCGDARLSQSVAHRVHSFDLVASNDCVTPCNMTSVPLSDSSVDVCVFCLSLMNSNIIDFIMEARRVLKVGGVLKIIEIKSRMKSIREFVSKIKECSFNLDGKPHTLNKLFVDFTFTLKNKRKRVIDATQIQLNPCLYKKR